MKIFTQIFKKLNLTKVRIPMYYEHVYGSKLNRILKQIVKLFV